MTETQGATVSPPWPQIMMRLSGTDVQLAAVNGTPDLLLEVESNPYVRRDLRLPADSRLFNYDETAHGYLVPAEWICGFPFRCRFQDARGNLSAWSTDNIIANSAANMERHGG